MKDDTSDSTLLHIAVIGGGVAGAVCARQLAKCSQGKWRVTVFDQGRSLGGRSSHRRVNDIGDYLSADSCDASYAFDHGCQFFRADSSRFQREILQEWLDRKWVAEWTGKFATLGNSAKADFFGFPHQGPYYCGVGGMSSLPNALLEDSKTLAAVDIHIGVRVADTARLSNGKWLLRGTSGKAAFHDTAEEDAARVSPDALGEFDTVVVTDVSASMEGWHRASAGLPKEVAAKIRGRTRVCLFTALVAFETALAVEEAAFSAGDDCLWFAGRTQSKPGLANSAKYDCWTLVSTPKFAAAEISRVPMQDPKTGAFRPQEMSYLREGPCSELLNTFKRLLLARGYTGEFPKVLYIGGQRWGSAFPAPTGVEGRDATTGRGPSTVEILNVAYESAQTIPLTPQRQESIAEDQFRRSFVADDDLCMYFASDYASNWSPGLEATALSALDVSKHLHERLCKEEAPRAKRSRV